MKERDAGGVAVDQDTSDDMLVTIPAAGAMLSVGRQTAYKLVRDGILGPVVNLGPRRKRLRKGDVRGVIKRRSEGGGYGSRQEPRRTSRRSVDGPYHRRPTKARKDTR